MKNDYVSFLFTQLKSTLEKANMLLSTVDLDDFYMDFDVAEDPENDNEEHVLTAVEAFNKVVECTKLIAHATDLSDVLVDSVSE